MFKKILIANRGEIAVLFAEVSQFDHGVCGFLVECESQKRSYPP